MSRPVRHQPGFPARRGGRRHRSPRRPAAGAPEYAVINLGQFGGLFAGQDRTEHGVSDRTRGGLGDRPPERVVCLDAGFAGNDQIKANAVQIFKTKGVTSFKTV